ncbi:GNAT family N-acetyltransferase [Pseudonocardia nantongensis]|uniref:GNAT family N-acetyltransferase n=1 Tax=Pseudonocardia nantongensis TaxID=1181885 RepID=UPI00397B065C
MPQSPDSLTNPVPAALHGRLHAFGAVRGGAVRFDAEVSPFAGLPPTPSGDDWADLAALCEPGSPAVLVRPGDGPPDLPPGWSLVHPFPGVQMEGSGLQTEPDEHAVELGPDDRAEMAGLAARTRPGPWLERTAELGRYLGIRHDGRLVAMAGERMRLGPEGAGGACEISAVCTDEEWRGKGLAARLVRAVAAGIVARGELPVLHASAVNEGAIRLYRRMGFTITREMRFDMVQAPVTG